jgi:hypothetical protein
MVISFSWVRVQRFDDQGRGTVPHPHGTTSRRSRTISTATSSETSPDGPYPHRREYGYAGKLPSNRRISTINNSVPIVRIL